MELGSHISNALGAFLLPETDYTKQLQLDSNMGVGPSTPQNKQRGAKGAEMVSVDFFSTVPEEVLAQIATRLDSTSDLCALASVAKRWHTVVEGCSDHWRSLFQQAYCIGAPSPAQYRAAELASSWKKLFQSRFMAQAEVSPWEKPSPFEIQAAIEQMYLPVNTTIENNSKNSSNTTPTTTTEDSSGSQPVLTLPPTPKQLHHRQQQQHRHQKDKEDICIIFLVDGSGSVTEEDFNCMTSFMLTAADQIQSTQHPHQQIFLGVIQFSNEVRVELPPTKIISRHQNNINNKAGGGDENITNSENDAEDNVSEFIAVEDDGEEEENPFIAAVEGMVRINGGTNIAAAIQKAGQLFKTLTTTTSSDNAPAGENIANTNGEAVASGSAAPNSPPPSDCRKIIALLTDGRIDSFQSHEAKEITARLVDEQGNVALHAFGVGRGVDRLELLKIVGGSCSAGEDAANRYLPLMVLEDAPW